MTEPRYNGTIQVLFEYPHVLILGQDARTIGPRPPAPNQPTAQSAKLQPSDGPLVGPALGPSGPPQELEQLPSESGSAPPSPYSSSRSMIRNLTMPSVPNFDIPPSPPGSPPPGPTAKFARFLELKKQGIHFNEKLERSSALRNPSLLQKLMDFAGISEEDQYASTLPPEVTVPTSFPAWAYVDQLGKTQQEITKKREAEKAKMQREAIDFVPSTGSGASSRAATPGSTAGRSVRGSAAERIMAGLDRDKPRSPMTQDGMKRKETERRRTRFDDTGSGYRSRSRSPRRKRSRSR